MRLKRSQLEIVQGTNPFPRTFKDQGTLIKLRSGKKEIYLLNDYYSDNLDSQLSLHFSS